MIKFERKRINESAKQSHHQIHDTVCIAAGENGEDGLVYNAV